MSDQYLFEGKGSDPEIRRLEKLLSIYRIEPVAPSLNQAHQKTVGSSTFGLFRRRFLFASAVGSFAAMAIALVLVFWFFRPAKNDVLVTAPERLVISTRHQDSIVETTPAITKVNRRLEIAKTRKLRFRRTSAPIRVTASQLTPQEKYAYQQVLVALWITGSKLKVVQDTINRVNDENENSTNEKR